MRRANAKSVCRPHDLELSLSRTTTTQLEATVRFVVTVGSRVWIELESKDSPQVISVELTRERYRELTLQQGEWSMCARNNNKYSECQGPRRYNEIPTIPLA